MPEFVGKDVEPELDRTVSVRRYNLQGDVLVKATDKARRQVRVVISKDDALRLAAFVNEMFEG